MKVEHFEDLEIWKESRKLVVEVYKLTSNEILKKDFGLKEQMQRAAVSIMNNIAEGFERDSNKEFIRFLFFAKGSAGEIRSLLYITLDLNLITKDKFKELFGDSVKLIKKISTLIKYLKTKT
ncbi:MAG TPA: four helix bundle protein [Ignavibacteria bacterium]|nr:four helix bundle protein [Ignavibacteria bacterium]